MRSYSYTLLTLALAASHCAARDIPSNIQSFYDGVKSAGQCSNKLATGFYAEDDGPNSK